MLKKLLNSCFDAYRGSHKSVIAGHYIATDLSFPTGYENVNANGYAPPSDGVFVIHVGVQQFNIDIRNKTIPISYTCWDNPVGWRGGWMPVRKGDVVEFKVWGGSSVGDKTYADCVAFIKTKASA